MPALAKLKLHVRRWRAGIALALAASFVTTAGAQVNVANENSVKASFVFNFARYAEWPARGGASGLPLRICSPSRNPLEGQLVSLDGRQHQGRTVEVRLRALPDDWRTCHVLFLPADEREFVDLAVKALAETPVLLVSDSAEFARRGGTIEVKTVGARIRFEINLAAAQRAGLKLSSHMLRLADRVVQ